MVEHYILIMVRHPGKGRILHEACSSIMYHVACDGVHLQICSALMESYSRISKALGHLWFLVLSNAIWWKVFSWLPLGQVLDLCDVFLLPSTHQMWLLGGKRGIAWYRDILLSFLWRAGARDVPANWPFAQLFWHWWSQEQREIDALCDSQSGGQSHFCKLLRILKYCGFMSSGPFSMKFLENARNVISHISGWLCSVPWHSSVALNYLSWK